MGSLAAGAARTGGESVAVDVVLSDAQVHQPPTRKDTLILFVHSDLPDSPWFDAGVHRSLRAPASFLNLTCGPPMSASILFPLETFSIGALGQNTFSLLSWRVSFRSVFCFLSLNPGTFLFHYRLVPGQKPL